MSGTKEGGKKAAATNIVRHGEDFYKRIGQKGGKNGHTGGFAANPALASIAGAKGGRSSSRGIARKVVVDGKTYRFPTVKEATRFVSKKFSVIGARYSNGKKILQLENGNSITVEKDQ